MKYLVALRNNNRAVIVNAERMKINGGRLIFIAASGHMVAIFDLDSVESAHLYYEE